MEFKFHEGEVAIQSRLGLREKAESLQGMVHPQFKPGHPDFIKDRTEAFVGSVDPVSGEVWSSAIFGPPGFLNVISNKAMEVTLGINKNDPLLKNAAVPDAPLGFLFIELMTRRRNRMNGVSNPRLAPPGGLHVTVQESYGNCPKYIQRRQIRADFPLFQTAGGSTLGNVTSDLHQLEARRQPLLSRSQIEVIEEADFFTIATLASKSHNADVSHRGGSPGFVRVISSNELLFPDYRGNNLLMTLGNIMTNPRAGLLFIDWKTRSTLQLTGRAEVLFFEDVDALGLTDHLDGATRAVKFIIDGVLETPEAVPFSYELIELSPYNPELKKRKSAMEIDISASTPSQTASTNLQISTSGRSTTTEIVTLRKIRQVAEGVKDFEFEAAEGLSYLPGQYASFLFDIPASDGSLAKDQSRTWTISSAQLSDKADNKFHITVKLKSGGLATTWLHTKAREGEKVRLTGIDGHFTCFTDRHHLVPEAKKLLFLTAGIGITPLLSMLRGLRALPRQSKDDSGEPIDVIVIHSTRSIEEVPFLEELAASFQPRQDVSLKVLITVSQGSGIVPTKNPTDESPSLLRGRLTPSVLVENVPALSQRQVYICGPENFMSAAQVMLEANEVKSANIYTEKFDF